MPSTEPEAEPEAESVVESVVESVASACFGFSATTTTGLPSGSGPIIFVS